MKRILIATDLTTWADRALIRAGGLAARSGAALHVLHAAPADGADREALRRELSARTGAAMACAGAPEPDIQVSARHPAQAILHEAARRGADLIVLGGHARPRFRDAIFGTVGTHVARHSDIPILIVQTDPALPYAKLMVAADGAEGATRLVGSALAIAPEAEVFTVHAFTLPIGESLLCRTAQDDEARQREASLRAALSQLATTRPQALLDDRQHLIIEEGDALTVIMDKTEALVPDLVVMGTRHRDTFIGSLGVDSLFWCPADLLIVPEPAVLPADA